MNAKRTGTKGQSAKKAPVKRRAGTMVAAAAPAVGAEAPGGRVLGAGAADSPLVIDGYVRVTINAEQFELRGTVGEHLKVAWHKPFEEGVNLGSVLDMSAAVAKALGVQQAEAFAAQLKARIDGLIGVPALEAIAKVFTTDPVIVTDLAIDTEVGKYQFGFGVDLSGNEPPLGYKGVEMTAFGLLFTYSRPPGTE